MRRRRPVCFGPLVQRRQVPAARSSGRELRGARNRRHRPRRVCERARVPAERRRFQPEPSRLRLCATRFRGSAVPTRPADELPVGPRLRARDVDMPGASQPGRAVQSRFARRLRRRVLLRMQRRILHGLGLPARSRRCVRAASRGRSALREWHAMRVDVLRFGVVRGALALRGPVTRTPDVNPG